MIRQAQDLNAMGVRFSLVVPAYNEAHRITPHLASVRSYLSSQFASDYEVIVVDDGSGDGLGNVVARLSRDWPQLTLIRHGRNRGKGAAVRTGMLAAKGQLLLFTDADGAAPIEEEKGLRAAIGEGADIAAGSRLVADGGVHQRRSWPRKLMGRAFSWLAHSILRPPIRDTQCGFKMFRQDVGQHLFRLGREQGYLFDLELLLLAARLHYRIAEVPINWSDVPGSKLNMTRESYRILAGLWRIRRRTVRLRLDPAHEPKVLSEENKRCRA